MSDPDKLREALSSPAATILLRSHTCHRCVLRFTGVRDHSWYKLPDEALCRAAAGAGEGHQDADGTEPAAPASEASLLDTPVEPAPAEPEATVCPLCLGMLQHTLSSATKAELTAQFVAAGFNIRTFGLSVSVPPALYVRQRGAWLHLRKELNSAHGVRSIEFASIVDVKDPLRWLLAPLVAELVSGTPLAGGRAVSYDPGSPVTITANVTHPSCAADHEAVVVPMLPAQQQYYGGKRMRSQGYGGWSVPEADSTRTVLRMISAQELDPQLGSTGMVPPPAPPGRCTFGVGVERLPVCLRGRYNKYSRALPQTAWIIDGARKCAGSVQECVEGPPMRLFGCAEAKFHSAGREDVDVRMLGEGRPFVLELLQPKTAEHTADELAAMVRDINESDIVQVSALETCSTDVIGNLIKEGEDSHRKDYRCVVRVSRRLTPADISLLNATTELLLQQKTPLRVLHRRTQMVRPRTVHEIVAVQLGSHVLQLDLCTQAGTYVKEFVHSDFGRTHPSVGSLLGCEADILQLDVLGLRD
tara:strand:+ start:1325 stop:2914 length:1590 start_codon:yes stop_codon:yes gene_type:complete